LRDRSIQSGVMEATKVLTLANVLHSQLENEIMWCVTDPWLFRINYTTKTDLSVHLWII